MAFDNRSRNNYIASDGRNKTFLNKNVDRFGERTTLT